MLFSAMTDDDDDDHAKQTEEKGKISCC